MSFVGDLWTYLIKVGSGVVVVDAVLEGVGLGALVVVWGGVGWLVGRGRGVVGGGVVGGGGSDHASGDGVLEHLVCVV